jgi:paired amphipathic helix protein Sin3a
LGEAEKRAFRMPPLPQVFMRVVRKLYGAQTCELHELLAKLPGAAVPIVLHRLQAKVREWDELTPGLARTWVEVYERSQARALDHRSFHFKQADKKHFSGKQVRPSVRPSVRARGAESRARARWRPR